MAAISVLCLVAWAARAPARQAAFVATPTTLAVSPGGVFALAQDGARLAWLECEGKSPAVRVGVPGHAFSRIEQRSRFCHPAVGLALAGEHVLWAVDGGGNSRDIGVLAASLPDTRPRAVGHALLGAGGYGEAFGGLAGDGSALVYTTVSVWRLDEADEAAGASCVSADIIPCRTRLLGGRVATVVGRRAYTLAKRGGSVIAAGDGLVALARAGGMTTVANVGPLGTCACLYTPRWSPDDKRLAYASGAETDGASLYVADGAGGKPRRITRGAFVDMHPAWSPDGRTIAFHRVPVRADHKLLHPTIYTIGDNGSGLRRLGVGRDPAFAFDGRIAFTRSRSPSAGVYTMSASGGSVRRVVKGTKFGVYRSPTWSPDGTRIAYLDDGCRSCVYLVPASGGTPRELEADAPLHAVEWSHDGTQLLLSGETGISARRLADNSTQRLVPRYRGSFATWSSDDGRIAFVRHTAGAIEVFALTRTGGAVRRLTRTLQVAPRVPVEVRRLRGGGLVTAFEPHGDVRALAVSRTTAAALVLQPSGKVFLELYSVPRGHLLRSVPLPASAADPRRTGRGSAQLSLEGSTLLYNVGRSIRTLDVRTGAAATLATARALPVGLSLEGTRVLWAENFGLGFDTNGDPTGRGEIRALTLPG